MEPIKPLENSAEKQVRISLHDLIEMLAQPLGLDSF